MASGYGKTVRCSQCGIDKNGNIRSGLCYDCREKELYEERKKEKEEKSYNDNNNNSKSKKK